MIYAMFSSIYLCVHLILRDCDLLDMELVNTKMRLQISYMIRYNTINLRMYLNRQYSDCNVAAESYSVQFNLFFFI